MTILGLTLLASALFNLLALSSVDEPPKVPPSRTVGSVYGKAVTAGDIGLTAPIDSAVPFDARDSARWELMGRITAVFGRPVVERFVQQQKIAASADEIEMFKSSSRRINERNVREWEGHLAVLREQLAAPHLSNEERV
jgi:hypothetical protein